MDIALDYLSFLILCLIGIGLSVLFLCLAIFLGPKRKSKIKEMPFESGLDSQGISKKNTFSVNYYLVAMLFLAFDVEIIFLYPWAANFRNLGWYGFFAILIFLSVLVFGLIYEWKKGVLEWD